MRRLIVNGICDAIAWAIYHRLVPLKYIDRLVNWVEYNQYGEG